MNPSAPPTRSQAQGLRIFVSSTFADMQEEREELIKYVFPKLRRLCEARGVSWTSVDLRWGITDEEKAEGRVLDICFAEIDRCRPYFIGLLGSRYGWVPESIDPLDTLCPACATDAAGRSVTELEIRHGALNHRDANTRSLFYFRHPSALAEEPEDVRLHALKQQILSAGLPVRDGFRSARELGDWLLDDLAAAIESDLPIADSGDPNDREAWVHNAFASCQTEFHVPREDLLKRIDAHLENESRPLVISGEAGAGKTALLAAWSLRQQQTNANTAVIVCHFVGASPGSGEWTHLVRRLIQSIDRAAADTTELPDSADALRLAFAKRLASMDDNQFVIALIDGLDQLHPRDGARRLAWLPEVVPPGLKIVFTSAPGDALDEIRRRHWPELALPPLTLEEANNVATRFLRAYGKSLPGSLLETLRTHPQTGNPLHLRVLLEELRVTGVHEMLPQQLQRYLACDSTEALLDAVLARYEHDYERDRPGLVDDAMSLLWASRNGLSEEELLDLLGSEGERLPSAVWVPLSLAAGFALDESTGLLNLFHQRFRQAVESRYLAEPGAAQRRHTTLSTYFHHAMLSQRKLDELPWQLAAAGQWDDLAAFLSERESFAALWQHDPHAVQQFWREIEEHSEQDLAKAYQPLLDDPKLDPVTAHDCSILLQNTGHSASAVPFADFIIDHYRASSELHKLAMTLSTKSLLLIDIGRLDQAEEVLDEAQPLAERLVSDDTAHTVVLTNILTARAQIEMSKGRIDRALDIHRRIGERATAADDPGLLAESLYRQAFLSRVLDQTAQAESLLEQARKIYEDAGDLDGLASVANEAAKLRLLSGDTEHALALFRKAAALYETLNQPSYVATCLDDQARIYGANREFERAAALFADAQTLFERNGNLRLLSWSLANEAEVLVMSGNIHVALGRFEKAEQLCREMHAPDQLVTNLNRQAEHRIEIDDLDRATRQLEEAEALLRSAIHNDTLLGSNLLSQATAHEMRHRYDLALLTLIKAEPICRQSGNAQLLFLDLWGQSSLLTMAPPETMSPATLSKRRKALVREASELAHGLGYEEIAQSLRDQADAL